ncbi:hypothetical protein M0208_13930 [Sphingomonas sp. SUN019]|uniref:hypothetical protein n=1 Tax=Sphingomonas sp. SUN019 TaxID=2937788 RepID=UPI00216435EF|nr:hypothetical protein [Sphingomonas sp. SUN019]UVO51547.1 hypothetical protein M0208_13930 [Sphingomonas sp. SUN019]
MKDGDAYLESPVFSDWPADDDILIELGRLMTIWGGLESGLNVAIGKLAGFDAVADVRPMILIAHGSFPQRVDNLSSLCHQLQDQFDNLRVYQEVVSALRAVQAQRNKYAHNMVVKDPLNSIHVMSRFSARNKILYDVETVSARDIRKVTFQVHAVSLKLHALVTGKVYPPIWDRFQPKEP